MSFDLNVMITINIFADNHIRLEPLLAERRSLPISSIFFAYDFEVNRPSLTQSF